MNPFMDSPLLQVERLQLGVDSRLLVRDLSLQLERGQRWAVLGRNGVGKSTLLRTLAGLGSGSVPVRLFGRLLSDWSPSQLAGLRALMPAQPVDRFQLDVLESLLLVQPSPDPAAAMAWLERVDAAQLAARDLTRLSAGERQRVALAQALAQQAALLLLDEPASFQDPAHQTRLARLLASCADRTLLLVAHDLNWVVDVATHVLGLREDGSWIAGPAEQLLQPAILQSIYGCGWQRLPGSGGRDYWAPL